jgi:hypothetical protein
MGHELRIISIKIVGLLILSPFMGFVLLRCYDILEKYWKTNNRRKRWLVMSGVFFLLACIGGWLQ